MIDRLVNREGYTLKGAKSAIREGKGPATTPSLAEQASSAISVATGADVGDILPQLKNIRSRLAAALEA